MPVFIFLASPPEFLLVSRPAWPDQSFSFGLFFFAYYGYVGVFSPYGSLYFADLGMSVAQIGLLMSLMQVMRIFGPNLWGWIADHRQQRVMVLRATAAASVISLSGLFFADGFGQLLVVMIVFNLFTSAHGPLSEALMLSRMRGDLTHYGRLRLWGSVGFIVAVSVTGQLLDWFSVGLVPWIALLLLALVLVAALRMKEAEPPVALHRPVAMAELLRRREVIAFFVSTFLMILAHASVYVYLSLFLAEIGYSKTVIGLIWSLGVIAEIVFFFWQAPLFIRFGIERLMIASLLIGVARFLMIGFCAESLVWLLLAQVLHAATFGAHHSASVATLQRWFAGPLQARGQALFISISYGLGGSSGGLLLSVFWDTFGARSVYLVAAVCCLAGAASAALSYRWQRKIEGRE